MEEQRKPKKYLKVAVLKENLLALTGGDFISALILNQLIYWTKIAHLSDQQKREQMEVAIRQGRFAEAKELESQLTHGWFFKSGQHLADEIMITTRTTVVKRLKELEKRGLIRSKQPKGEEAKWYYVNMDVIEAELRKLGYTLDGYLDETEEAPADTPITGMTVLGEEYSKAIRQLWFERFDELLPKDTLDWFVQDAVARMRENGYQKADPEEVYFYIAGTIDKVDKYCRDFKKGPIAATRAALQGEIRFENPEKHNEKGKVVPIPSGYQPYDWVNNK